MITAYEAPTGLIGAIKRNGYRIAQAVCVALAVVMTACGL